MMDLQAAQRLVLECVGAVGEESVELRASVGRILAQDLFADEDIVPFARSAMDGFAVRAADTLGASKQTADWIGHRRECLRGSRYVCT